VRHVGHLPGIFNFLPVFSFLQVPLSCPFWSILMLSLTQLSILLFFCPHDRYATSHLSAPFTNYTGDVQILLFLYVRCQLFYPSFHWSPLVKCSAWVKFIHIINLYIYIYTYIYTHIKREKNSVNSHAQDTTALQPNAFLTAIQRLLVIKSYGLKPPPPLSLLLTTAKVKANLASSQQYVQC
jgi:hypothetical protein